MWNFLRGLLVVACFSPCLVVQADDWPQWGGPKRDIIWRETGIVDKFPTDGLLPRVWSTPIGEGYSGPAVANGRVYITDFQRDERQERVLCLDSKTGEILWKHAYPVVYRISYPAGPRSTPVVDNGLVYTIGAMGDMFCFDAKSGEAQWKKNFVDEYDTNIPIWGMVASPLVRRDQLITLVGGDNALVVSFDKTTGKELWKSLNDPEVGYCPPVIFSIHGKEQLIVWHPRAVSSLNPDDGKVNWEVPFRVRAGLTVPMPRQLGNRIFVTSFYNGSRMLEVAQDGKSAEVVWQGKSNSELPQNTDGLHSIMPTPVLTDSHIYGVCSYGQLRCLDVQTGERIWESAEATGKDRWWNAFLVPHEDRYFIHNEQGDLIIA
ncbi:MAG: PQQ-like beta-propeller repeat protein, partial [Planctomycetaceae bacterium]|nr:PQQ-like beta-propeller repeat protein [Planctomycetaceae bacterium]